MKSILVLLLLGSGCSLSYEHGGVSLGQSAAQVKARLRDLREPVRIEGEGLKVKSGRLVRVPEDDPDVAFEFYEFTDGELTMIQIAYTPEADSKRVLAGVKATLGAPDLQALNMISTWEKEGGGASFVDFGETRAVRFYFEGEEEPREVSLRSLLLVARKTSYRFVFLGTSLLCALLALGAVFSIKRELGQVRRATPAIRTRADLNAYRRIGYRHKLADAGASVLLLVGGVIAVSGHMQDQIGLLDLFVLIPAFGAYAFAGKAYSALGKDISARLPVEDPELQAPWDAWIKVMNTPLALGGAKAMAEEASA